jgi:hypothetical protein
MRGACIMRQGKMRVWNSAGGNGRAQVHDEERGDTLEVREREAESGRATPILTEDGCPLEIELAQ